MRHRKTRRIALLALPLVLAPFVLRATTAGARQTDPPLPYDVSTYDVDIAYTPGTGVLRGSTTITATAGGPLDSVELALQVPATGVSADGREIKSFRQDEGVLSVDLDQPLDSGQGFTLEIVYEGEPGNSPAWVPTTDGGSVTVTQAANGTWFPLHNTSRDQANLKVKAAVPADWTVISNGTQDDVEVGEDTAVFRWKTSRELSPSGALLGMGPWETERSRLSDGTPVTNVYGAGQKELMKPLADQTSRMADFLSERFGRYPFGTFGGIYVEALSDEVPFYASQGRVTFPAPTWANESVLLHELSHQWFGVSVTGYGEAEVCVSSPGS